MLARYPECEMRGIDYGEVFPWEEIEETEEVWLVDFSLPMADMFRLAQSCRRVMWIDHHVSAQREFDENFVLVDVESPPAGLEETPKVVRAIYYRNRAWTAVDIHFVYKASVGACELTWGVCYPGRNLPEGVRLLSRYDVWRWGEDADALPFQTEMRRYRNLEPEARNPVWDEIFGYGEAFVEQTIETGHLLMDFMETESAKYAKMYAFEAVLALHPNDESAPGKPGEEKEGIVVLALNRGNANSMALDSIWDPQRFEAKVLFCGRPGAWKVSLYGDEESELDLSVVAKAYGGGGHAKACGFRCAELPLCALSPAGPEGGGRVNSESTAPSAFSRRFV